jgi:hypothetical protein
VLQLSQHIALFFVVTAFWHVPHGHLGVLGPGFDSVSEEFAISNRHRYSCTFLLVLYLRYLVTLRLLYKNHHYCGKSTQPTQNSPFKPSKQDKHNIKKSMNQNDNIAGKTVT